MLLEELSNASGVAGNEGEVREKLIAAVKDHVDEYRVDTIGNLITLKKGTGPEPRLKASPSRACPEPVEGASARRVMMAAHMDEVGLMVVAIEQSGHLCFRPVGGIDARVLLSKIVYVGKDKIPGVIGVKPIHLLKPKEREQVLEIDQLTIDIGAKSQEEAQGLVKLGDYAAFATTFATLGGTVKGKALDDRAGCAVLAEVIQGGPYPCDLYAVFTVQEEVGLRGAMVAAYAVSPDLGFALEGTVCDDSPKKKDLSPTTRLGGGPAITIMDRSVIADKRLVKLLMNTAKELGIPYQIKQPGVGGTDAGRIHVSKEGVPSVAVAVPCRYIHSPVSLLDLTDFQNTVKLMKGVLGRVASWNTV